MTDTATLLDTTFWITAGGIMCLLVMSAFFSGSETALTAASRAKMKTLADKGSRGAIAAMTVTEDNERMIGAILLGNNVVNILSASLATALLTRMFGDSGVAYATAGMTVLVLIFGEVLPKTVSITFPEAVAVRVAPVIRLLILIFAPIVGMVRALVRGILRLFGVKANPEANMLAVREEIMGVIALGHSEGAVEKEDRDRILGALDLADRTVEEIMRHRSEIRMLNADTPPAELLSEILQSPHTRLPIWKENPDNIVGVVHAKDVLRGMHKLMFGTNLPRTGLEGFNILDVAMKPYFIPDTTTLDEQMRQFLRRHTHFALVVDEYGSIQGLITLEDILEEIVGEITDEFDIAQEPAMKPGEDGAYVIDGTMTIRDLNRAMDWSLPDDEANTVAGLVIHEAQMIPSTGQVFSFHGFRFEVTSRKENRITKIKIKPL
jgi:Mg2+/Co2+ transporter CorB